MRIGSFMGAAMARTHGTHIGTGSSRRVYLYDGVVYKYEIEAGSNRDEYDNIIRLTPSLVDGVLFPTACLYTIGGMQVMAMEYIEGTALICCDMCVPNIPCHDDCLSTLSNEYALVARYIKDTEGNNIIINDNGIYIIDVES